MNTGDMERTTPSAAIHRARSPESVERARLLSAAIRLSLFAGAVVLAIKLRAYALTGSVAIFSDVAESVAHFFIVCFAAYSVRLSHKPADKNHLYGHDRINFFSAGVEGAFIAAAGLFILYESSHRWWTGDLQLREPEQGIAYIALATAINAALGLFLIRRGKKMGALVLEANGRHVLADGVTSLGVIAGLVLASATGWTPFDPLVAIVVALHVLWSGAGLVRRSIGGLMDSADPATDAKLRQILDEECRRHGVHYHFLRHRNAGSRLIVDFHLLFENETTIARAHDISTMIERTIAEKMPMPAEVTTHFEPLRGHDEAHRI